MPSGEGPEQEQPKGPLEGREAPPRFFTLSQITARVEEILRPATGKLFWVKAEVSSGRERGGSFYCDLVETDERGSIVARMSCTFWSRDLTSIRRKFKDAGIDLRLDDGTELGLRCSLQYTPRYGLSLRAVDADPAFALGELELRRRAILLRLEREGLFETNKALPVPMLPQRIGVVTSRGSAAFNDFVKTLSLSRFGFTILAADTVVQGAQTEASVLAALDILSGSGIDLVAVIRGGGSRSDLASLDNEDIARRIACFPVPVWTGIGHETDSCVLDFVANRRFKTPTAVAEEIVDRYREVEVHLEDALGRFRSTWSYRLMIARERIDRDRVGIRQGTRKLFDVTRTELSNRKNGLASLVKDRLAGERVDLGQSRGMIGTSARALLRDARGHVEASGRDFVASAGRYLALATGDLDRLRRRFRSDRFLALTAVENRQLQAKERHLRSADPVHSLRRGFSLAYRGDGRLIRSVGDVGRGERIRTTVCDGSIESTVEKTERRGDGERKG